MERFQSYPGGRARQEFYRVLFIAAVIVLPVGIGGSIGIAFVAVKLSWNPALTGLVFGSIVILIAVTCAVFYISRKYLWPLENLLDHLQKMREKDFTTKVEAMQQGMIGEFAKALNGLSGTLREVINEQAQMANQLTTASDMMSSVSKETTETAQETANTVAQLARGAEEQVNTIMTAQSTDRKSVV